MNTRHLVVALSAAAFIAISGMAHARTAESSSGHSLGEGRRPTSVTVGHPQDAFGYAAPSNEPAGPQYHGGPKSDF